MLVELFLCFLIQDVVFYVGHRFLHSPLSKGIHKIHHQWLVPIGFTAYYTHPLESYVNAFVALIGPRLFASTLNRVYCWFFLAIFYGIIAHATSGAHDFHHKYRYVNFSTGVTDRIMGTYYKAKKEELVPLPKWIIFFKLGITLISIGVSYLFENS